MMNADCSVADTIISLWWLSSSRSLHPGHRASVSDDHSHRILGYIPVAPVYENQIPILYQTPPELLLYLCLQLYDKGCHQLAAFNLLVFLGKKALSFFFIFFCRTHLLIQKLTCCELCGGDWASNFPVLPSPSSKRLYKNSLFCHYLLIFCFK